MRPISLPGCQAPRIDPGSLKRLISSNSVSAKLTNNTHQPQLILVPGKVSAHHYRYTCSPLFKNRNITGEPSALVPAGGHHQPAPLTGWASPPPQVSGPPAPHCGTIDQGRKTPSTENIIICKEMMISCFNIPQPSRILCCLTRIIQS